MSIHSNKPVKLSYSSMKELQSCEQRYAHRKIYNTEKDSDYTESDALGLGKAFHQVLEKTLHSYWDEKLLIEAMVEHEVDQEEAELLRTMLDRYIEFRKKSGLKIVKCEMPIETSKYIGFIDALAIDPIAKVFWIVDLKTASRHDPNLIPQLSKDQQIGLYSYFAEDISTRVPEVLGYPFAGFKYCQTIKSKASTKKGLESGVKVYEMTILAKDIDHESAWSHFMEVHDIAENLNKGEAPKKNYSACFNYFSPCAYFSKCHGHNFTSDKTKVLVQTIESLNDSDFL